MQFLFLELPCVVHNQTYMVMYAMQFLFLELPCVVHNHVHDNVHYAISVSGTAMCGSQPHTWSCTQSCSIWASRARLTTLVHCPDMRAGHYPTWESAVGGFGSAKDFRQLRKSIAADPSSLKPPKPLGPRPRRIPPGEYNSYGQGHAMPFPGLLPHACIQRETQTHLQLPSLYDMQGQAKCQKDLVTYLRMWEDMMLMCESLSTHPLPLTSMLHA